jgi:hypothetical protein
MSGETDEDTLELYFEIAGEVIMRRVYPYGSDNTEVPRQYLFKQYEIATYLLNKRGAEGQTVHNENGINRTYESADVPHSMLKDIVPFVQVLGG